MLKVTFPIIAFAVFPCLAFTPLQMKEQSGWMSIQDAQTAVLKQKRPILIDLYTDWCGWCKVMDKKTYADKKVSSYIAEKFYPVKLNAESKEGITWAGRKFYFNPSVGANDIAVYLTGGRLSYPSTVIIAGDGSEPQAIPGYLKPREIEILLKYFGEGKYGKISFEQYQKSFSATW